MKNAVAYARVASEEQQDNLSDQLKSVRQYAKSQRLEVVREFTEAANAKENARQEFGKMLEFLEHNSDCRIVIVDKRDRLAWNFQDYVAMEKLGVEVHLVKEEQLIKHNGQSQDKFVNFFYALSARYHLENLREEICKGQITKAKRGEYPGPAPFGYMNNHGSRTISVDPKVGPVVTRMFDLYESGTHSIASLTKVMRDMTGESISRSSLQNVLKSRFYLGFFTWHGVEYKGIHMPLVDRDTFGRVQDVMSGRKGSSQRRHRAFRHQQQRSL